MKRRKKNLNLIETPYVDVHWNRVLVKPLGRNEVEIKSNEVDVTPDIHELFTDTKLTTELSINEDNLTTNDMLETVKGLGFLTIYLHGETICENERYLNKFPKLYEKFEIPLYFH